MAKKLIWSQNAKKNRQAILHFWMDRTKSRNYSSRLNELFKILVEFLYSGIQISGKKFRGKPARAYCILHNVPSENVDILFIWDTRRDSDELLNLVKNFS